MNQKRFALFNIMGAVLWTAMITLLGYFLGDRIPFVRENLDLIFIAIILISVLPLLIELIKGYAAKGGNRA